MSLARKHQARILAMQTVAAVPVRGGHTPTPAPSAPVDREANIAAAQIAMRLTHDLRRLRAIKSILGPNGKIAAKRGMLPAYADWVAGLLAGSLKAGTGTSCDVLPTIMIWLIDVGDYDGAMPLIEHVLRHRVPLPSRYDRDAPTLIVEEIADAAIKAQTADEPFNLAVLEAVEALTIADDMHDQVRAKLKKAIGCELDRAARHPANADAYTRAALQRARASLLEAQALNPRAGVKAALKSVEKRLAAASESTP